MLRNALSKGLPARVRVWGHWTWEFRVSASHLQTMDELSYRETKRLLATQRFFHSPGPRSFPSLHCTLRQKDTATGVEILWTKRKKAGPSPPPPPLPQSHFGSRTEDMKPDRWQQKSTVLEMFTVQKVIFYQEAAGIFLKIIRQTTLWRINVWTKGCLHLPSV